MVDLKIYTEDIKRFFISSIDRFQLERAKPNSIGIYCCPWSAWMTTNFNVDKKMLDTDNNCPDFEYAEFDFMELSEWKHEYEKDKPEFLLNDSVIILDHEHGDENFNKLIFDYLKPILTELKDNYSFDFLLQMLDSRMVEEI